MEQIEVVNYGKVKYFDNQEQAIKFYVKCAMASEGSEQSRYMTILSQLVSGLKKCSDEV